MQVPEDGWVNTVLDPKLYPTGSAEKYIIAWEDDDVMEAFLVAEERGFLIFVDSQGKKHAARKDSLSRFERLE